MITEQESLSSVLEMAQSSADVDLVREKYAQVLVRLGTYASVLDAIMARLVRQLETFKTAGEVKEEDVQKFFNALYETYAQASRSFPDARLFTLELVRQQSLRQLLDAGVDPGDSKAVVEFYKKAERALTVVAGENVKLN